MNRITEAKPSTNGKAKSASKPARPRKAPAKPRWNVKQTATVSMGVLLPLLSLGLSHAGGKLLQAGLWGLALLAGALMACVLYVSLQHLAWSVQDITGSPARDSWALALAFDLVLVLGELVHTYGEQAGIGLVSGAMITVVCVVSMYLNVHAFLNHKGNDNG